MFATVFALGVLIKRCGLLATTAYSTLLTSASFFLAYLQVVQKWPHPISLAVAYFFAGHGSMGLLFAALYTVGKLWPTDEAAHIILVLCMAHAASSAIAAKVYAALGSLAQFYLVLSVAILALGVVGLLVQIDWVQLCTRPAKKPDDTESDTSFVSSTDITDNTSASQKDVEAANGHSAKLRAGRGGGSYGSTGNAERSTSHAKASQSLPPLMIGARNAGGQTQPSPRTAASPRSDNPSIIECGASASGVSPRFKKTASGTPSLVDCGEEPASTSLQGPETPRDAAAMRAATPEFRPSPDRAKSQQILHWEEDVFEVMFPSGTRTNFGHLWPTHTISCFCTAEFAMMTSVLLVVSATALVLCANFDEVELQMKKTTWSPSDLVMFFSVADCLGRLLVGLASDNTECMMVFQRPFYLLWSNFAVVLGFGVLALEPTEDDTLLYACLLCGFGFGSSLTIIPALCRESFGPKHMGIVLCVLLPVLAIGFTIFVLTYVHFSENGRLGYADFFATAVSLSLLALAVCLLVWGRRSLGYKGTRLGCMSPRTGSTCMSPVSPAMSPPPERDRLPKSRAVSVD
eukprot:gnl/TRDRNA2_/TRDRNA2_179066_c0_seq1.p1 gnl/TRDRNA2_/TRDRNA2_179066_c0~~gnl/TRDRNA2_/TRDRNA2_179066_c0_seq1.p1  ORF type:complete len:669 (-),score=64.33 gnl/TRDRNA2_/TRDRNA2_179066_c0_seq1:114-1838(-)